jgi:hypothetical protein
MNTPAEKNNCPSDNTSPLSTAALIIYFLCLIALRSTYPESYQHNPGGNDTFIAAPALSLITSFLILLPFAVFLLYKIVTAEKLRLKLFDICAAAFIIFAALSATQAPDKRAALNEILTLTAPILMAVFIIKNIKARLLVELILITVTALGIVSAARCVGQVLVDNQALLEMYQQDPLSQLEQLGIEPESFKHMLYEQRLKSKDVRGYFTTGNSAGSFFLLTAAAAAALTVSRIKNNGLKHPSVIITAAALALILFGLALTHSKGAIGAFIIFAPLTAVVIKFHPHILRHKKIVITLTLLLIIIAAAAFVYLVMTETEMPGGKSILVRMQYYKASIQMFLDNSLLGVGPGNFPTHYTKYKIPAAPETVSKPHNFILNILTQYGPEALMAFLIIAALPVYKSLFTQQDQLNIETNQQQKNIEKKSRAQKKLSFQKLMPLAGGTICVFLIISRIFAVPPALQSIGNAQQVDKVEFYLAAFIAAMIMYGIPAIVFLCSFYLLQRFNGDDNKTDSPNKTSPEKTAGNIIRTQAIIISLGLAAVMLHNLIDFAIFEPAVYTLYWLLTAVIFILVAPPRNETPHQRAEKSPRKKLKKTKTAIAALTAAALTAYLWFAVITPVAASYLLKRAYYHPSETSTLCEKAAAVDTLDPDPYELKASHLLQQNRSIHSARAEPLKQAAAALQKAILRSPHDFKLYKKKAIAFTLLSAISKDFKNSNDYIKMAHRSCKKAIQLYPGSAELHLRYAQLCERVDQPLIALKHFTAAIEIENQYRIQFRKMYPDRKMFSRLGQQNYEMAINNKDKLEKQLGIKNN